MNSNFRQTLRDSLIQSYKHRESPGTICAICGTKDSRYAFHVIEYSEYAAGNHMDGSYAICEKCAPPCKKCGLPIQTKIVIEFYKQQTSQNQQSHHLHWGVGVCDKHIRIFGITF